MSREVSPSQQKTGYVWSPMPTLFPWKKGFHFQNEGYLDSKEAEE